MPAAAAPDRRMCTRTAPEHSQGRWRGRRRIPTFVRFRSSKGIRTLFNSFAPLAWLVTLILTICFVFNYLSGGRAGGGAGINRVLALAVLLWALYSCWETFLVDPRANIRVDLVFIIPVLLIVTVAGLVQWLKG